MAVTLRTANLPAERMSRTALDHAVATIGRGAHVVGWVEVEAAVRQRRFRPVGRLITHPATPELDKRPISWRPRTVRLVGVDTWRVVDGWPPRVASFRAWQHAATFEHDGRRFTYVNVHMIHRNRFGIRRAAFMAVLDALLEYADQHDGPLVLGGDWNARPGDPRFRALRAAGFRPVFPGVTHGRTGRIDGFWVRDAAVLGARVMPRPDGGDHRPVTVTLDL